MSKEKHGFGSRIKYGFDNFMSKGGFSVFIALICLFVSAIVIMSAVRFVVNLIMPQESMKDIFQQWWLAFLQIADGGAIGEEGESNVLNRIVGIISLFVGMVLFSSLVAFITSQFEAMLVNLRKGKSNVIEKNHTVILGFGDRVLEIIRELTIANESERDAAVVVLSSREKDEMDDFFRDRIPDSKTTRIVTRSGSTSSLQLLGRIGIKSAKSVIILNDATSDAPDDQKALADARVLKTILAVITCTGEESTPPIVAEMHLKSKQNLALKISDKVSVIDEQSILAKVMVQTSRISGLALVYDHLVGFDGNEFYFWRPDDGWKNITYGDLIFHFEVCCVIGIRNEDGNILINPDKATFLKQNDEVILISEDDSTIKFIKNKLKVNIPSAKPASPQPKSVEKQLIIGWNKKAPVIVDEYSNYLIKDSGIDIILNDADDDAKKEISAIQASHPSVKIRIIKDNIDDLEALAKLKPEHYDNVIILSGDGGEAELRDSDTIAKLLQLRHYFKSLKKKDVKTQLITEVADSENVEIIQETGVKDFLVSNKFISKIYAQVSEDPDVLKVYEDLFREEGSEVYLKPVKLFLQKMPEKISFGDLCAAAIQRKESCFGVRIMDEEADADNHYGIYINPSKNEMFTLKPDDCLITLAEDET